MKSTFFRILLFYVGTILVIGLCINRNDPRLFSAYDDSDVAASPITVVFQQAGFGAAASVVNAGESFLAYLSPPPADFQDSHTDGHTERNQFLFFRKFSNAAQSSESRSSAKHLWLDH